MTDPEENMDDTEMTPQEVILDALIEIYGPEDVEGEELVEKALAECGGNLEAAQAKLADKLDETAAAIFDALDKVVPDRIVHVLAYDMICERIEAAEGKPEDEN
jgi:hypothetical protein